MLIKNNLFGRYIERWWRGNRFDSQLIISMFVLLFIGSITQFSVPDVITDNIADSRFIRHLSFIAMGLLVFYLGFKLPTSWLKNFWWVLYILALGLLIWVDIKGSTALGAQRWLKIGSFSMQPSEPAKIAIIIALANLLSEKPVKNLSDLIITGFTIVFLPFVLILLQPDLGTSLVLIAIFGAMTFWGGASLTQLLILYSPIIFIISSAIAFEYGLNFGKIFLLGKPVHLTCSYFGLFILISVFIFVFLKYRKIMLEKKLYFLFYILFILFSVFMAFIGKSLAWESLETYQQKRLIIFINPESDPQGYGYNILQSLYAIGSGGLFGQVYKQGPLTQGQFVPEQYTDFAFSAVTEEWGFFGTCVLLIAFFVLASRIFEFIKLSKNNFEKLLLVGILTFMIFHIFVNISMTTSLLPVVGVPLPFISYGGTAIWVSLFCLGIAQRINANNTRANLF